MTELLSARTQMGLTLAFHILFAVAGMAMPLMMVISEWRYLRTKQAVYLEIAKRWSKGTAILFAVGAVSGTVLSFELGLLWPFFMQKAGPIIGMPFSLEGVAFFLEAIFIGIYLYGWKVVPPGIHLLSGIAVAISGLTSGIFVMSVNSWMNTPTGFSLQGGKLIELDLVSAFFNPAFFTEALHQALAAYASIGFAAMGIHAWALLRRRDSAFHREAFSIALLIALVTSPLLIFSGDLAAKHLARHQPIKLAAIEGLFKTQRYAPLAIGGWPDVDQQRLRWSIEIPGLLSFLAQGQWSAEVQGLADFSAAEWPPLPAVHVAFQIMVGCGFLMLAMITWGGFQLWRRREFWSNRRFLSMATVAGPLGLIAIEAGWGVTEFGRQPWTIRGILRTAEAVTPMPRLTIPLFSFTLLYLILGTIVLFLLRAHVFSSLDEPKHNHG